jgi:EmrB/QacA subfamily drug resistance transporter
VSTTPVRNSGTEAANELTADRPLRLRVAVLVIACGQLMFVLDATIVNVALPHIQQALGFSGSGLEWIVTAYSLSFGGLLLLGGRSGDLIGRRRTFVSGLIVFAIASLAGGFARSAGWLIVCRGLQGAGAAFASPAALSLVATTFPEGPRRTRALGVYAAISTSGGAVGLLAGGVLTSYLSWRWVFFVNVPIGVAVAILAPIVLSDSEPHRTPLDLPGALSATGGMALLVYGLSKGATDEHGASHWADPPVLVSLVLAVLLLATFLIVERRVAHPLVPLRIFRDRARAGTYLIMVCHGTVMFGLFFFLTVFVQRVWGYTPMHTALIYVPLTVLLVLGNRTSSHLVDRIGPLPLLIAGFTLGTAGVLGLSRMGPHSHYLSAMLLPSYLTYYGLGMLGVPLMLTALAGLPKHESGLASGVYSASRQVGGATGLAVLGTIAWSAASNDLRGHLRGATLGAPGVPRDATRHALASGADHGFLAAAFILLAALTVALFTVRRRQPRRASTQPP